MSAPSFSNIDLWLFELAEGNLTATQMQQLELFLLQNPELEIEKDLWQASKIDATPIPYPHVELLEKKRPKIGMYATGTILILLLIGSGIFTYAELGVGSNPKVADLRAEVKRKKQTQILEYLSKQNDSFMSNGVALQGALFESFGFHGVQGSKPSSNDAQREYDRLLNVDQTNSSAGFSPNESGSNIAEARKAELNTHSVPNEHRRLTTTITSINALETEVNAGNVSEQVWDQMSYLGFEIDRDAQELMKVRPPREVDYSFDSGRYLRMRHAATKSSSKTSLKRKNWKKQLNHLSRNIQRMMNNPIALKNSRNPHYHVPGLSTMDVNFSVAGTLLSTRVQTITRAQWLGESNEQWMNQLALDGYSYGMRGGWGIQLNHSYYNNGGLQIGQAAFTYSPKISVTNSVSFEPSVRFKMGNKNLNADRMSEVDRVEIDRGNAIDFYQNGQTPIGKNLWYKDLGFGALVNTRWFFIGAQADNIFRYTDNIYEHEIVHPRRTSCNFIATIGTDWMNQKKTMSVSPYMVYQNNADLSELWTGVNGRWNWALAGLAVNDKLDPAASLGVKSKNFSIHYNVDYSTSAMTGEKALSHQVSLQFITKQSRAGRR